MKIKLVLFLLFISLILPVPANSQDAMRLSELQIDLWPEYDDPSVLVIYHITLPAETTLPTELSFRIPSAAGEPNAVAIKQPNGALYSVDHKTKISGEWEYITFTTTLLEAQLEYYDPGLQKDGSQRRFTYTWSGDYDVDQMTVQTQVPVGAIQMQIMPGPASVQVMSDGLTYYTKEIGSVAKDLTFSIDLAYQKDTNMLTVETLQVQPSAPLSTTNTWGDKLHSALPWLFPEGSSPYQFLPWVLGILAMVLIFGGGYWYWRSGKQEQTPRRKHRVRKATRTAETASSPSENVYCHKCGKRASAGDAFCRSCGERLRIE